MTADLFWNDGFALDIHHGYLDGGKAAPRKHHPRVVLNDESNSALRILREELVHADRFMFSVAFVTPNALALLKQELLDFQGQGCVVTSNYLGFNPPAAFAELLNLPDNIEARLHPAPGFHPKGYIFERHDSITAMVGSSNLTGHALTKNHEWNLKVTAARHSDLGRQFLDLVGRQRSESILLTEKWVEEYRAGYRQPTQARPAGTPAIDSHPEIVEQVTTDGGATADTSTALRDSPINIRPLPSGGLIGADLDPVAEPAIIPNRMQHEALAAIQALRDSGASKAVIISATGTGKTILSALDVQSFAPDRLLFVVHREQILDRTMKEYRKVLGGASSDYGKLAGPSKQGDRRYVFATVQTLSQAETLAALPQDAFDYLIIDEAHRAAAPSHRRILDHFTPTFLLGMTATPERTDGFNVFELFDFNVPYEIRLTHALEEDMLSPFHYYGISDVTFEDGKTTDEFTELSKLSSPTRVRHLIAALESYAQAGVDPRGLIFCSRKDEAQRLSAALNDRLFRGRRLRTVALSGDDSVTDRQAAVARFERGEIDYILTVDIFNEGVDIPTVNQVVMLRQTQSAIVFVQQLGRGLRKAPDKDYLVVIDFIGNYANNFLIPIALFGDESLDKESLRKKLIAAEEAGYLPGLSSVRFDKVSQQRVLSAIGDTNLTTSSRLKAALVAMRNRVGQRPALWDFHRFESVDPVLLATHSEHFPALARSLLGEGHDLTALEDRALALISGEVMTARRLHEFLILRALVEEGGVPRNRLQAICADAGVPADDKWIDSAIDSLSLEHHAEADQKRYRRGIVRRDEDQVSLIPEIRQSLAARGRFYDEVMDLLRTGMAIVSTRYRLDVPFTPGMQYGRKEAARLLRLPRKWTSTIYGYKADMEQGVCPIFVTLHKSEDVTASTAYEDTLLDPTTMLWYTKSNRTLSSKVEKAIVANELELHVFVKKDDAEGRDFYYLGRATATDAEETTMPGNHGKDLPVVRMHLRFAEPIEGALYDYFHPTVTLES